MSPDGEQQTLFEPKTLGDEFPVQQKRVREVLEMYQDAARMPGVNCNYAIVTIKGILEKADKAAISGDLVAMIDAYKEMLLIE